MAKRRQYVSDDRVTFMLSGIQIVEKQDQSAYGGGKERYYLCVKYRGNTLTAEYTDREKRDAMYAALRQELDRPADAAGTAVALLLDVKYVAVVSAKEDPTATVASVFGAVCSAIDKHVRWLREGRAVVSAPAEPAVPVGAPPREGA